MIRVPVCAPNRWWRNTENDIAPVLTISRRFVLAGTTTLLSTSSVGKWKDETDGVSATVALLAPRLKRALRPIIPHEKISSSSCSIDQKSTLQFWSGN